jgi:hypothetical protein
MPSTRGSFFTDWRDRQQENSTSRTLTITPSFSTSANAQYQDTLRIDITSNLPAVTIPYYLTDLTDDYFLSGTANGNITIDGDGNANITFQIDPFYDLANTYITRTTKFVLSNDYPNSIIGSTGNLEISNADTFDATGWEESNITASLDGLQGGYRLHKLVGLTTEQVGNVGGRDASDNVVSNLTVNSLGSDPANTDIEILIVGAGAQGGNGGYRKRTTTSPSTLNYVSSVSGAGGGGGEVVTVNLKANVFIANTTYPGNVANATYRVSTFDSATQQPVSGANSSFLGYTAVGGGHGGGQTPYSGVSWQGYIDADSGGSGGGAYAAVMKGLTANAGLSIANVTYGNGEDGGLGDYEWYGAFGNPLFTFTDYTFGMTPGNYRYKMVGGGGGGATEAGGNSSISLSFPTVSGTAGDGGEGFTSNISGSTEVYGSGGGAGGMAYSVTPGTGGTNAGTGGIWNESNTGGDSTHPEPRGGYGNVHLGAGGGGGGVPDEYPLVFNTDNGLVSLGGRGSDGVIMMRYLSQVRTIKSE